MATPQLDPYDEFPYINFSYPQSHINRLATLGTLLGMTPAPIESCRVLELACGDGSNLLPMAYNLPQSQFLGIDRAAKPIDKGTEVIKALRLDNMKLLLRDLMTVTRESIGKFDYIIAHGLYSWVPSPVQDRLLEIGKSCLAPQGILYVSYNVYPGCRQRQMVRDMILFHTRDVKDETDRVTQGRALINWLASAQPKPKAYSVYLKEVNDIFGKVDDGAIRHDIIAEVNTPVYFHEFISHASRHGLKFLSEAAHFNIREHEFPLEVTSQLFTLANESEITEEQYLDFLEGRSFRQTLLCHNEVKVERTSGAECIREFYLSSPARPESAKVDLNSNKTEKFLASEEITAATNFPLAKAALLHLGEIYPCAIHFDDLLVEAGRLIGPVNPLDGEEAEKASRTLAELLFKIYGVGVIEFHMHLPQFTVIPGERPLASSLARLQAQQGPITTSLFGNNVRFDDFLGRQFLLLLDGTRDRTALIKDFSEIMQQSFQSDDGPTNDQVTMLKELPDRLEEKLLDLGRRGFLLA